MGATSCFACGQSLFAPPRSAPSTPPPLSLHAHSEAQLPGPTPLASPRASESSTEGPPARPVLANDGPMAAPAGTPELVLDESMPPPVDLPTRRRPTLCKICFGPCTDRLTLVCDTCQSRAAATPEPTTPAVAFGKKLGTAAFRPPPARRAPTAGARARRAALWGALLVAAGFGVVHFARPPAPGASLSRDSSAAATAVDFAMPRDSVVHFRTTLDVQIKREEFPSTFADSLMTVFDLEQVATHDAEVMLVRGEGPAAVLDVRTECRMVSQAGEWEQKDGSRRPVYPWDKWLDVDRVRVGAEGPMVRLSGGEPFPARDVPPFLVFAHTGGPRGEMQPGARWGTTALLPCLVTRAGAIAPTKFDCRFRYVGRRVLDGRACAIVHLDATPLRDLDERFEHLDGVGGSVAGALAFDADSGLLVQADLVVDAYACHGGSNPDERVSMKGRVLVERTAK